MSLLPWRRSAATAFYTGMALAIGAAGGALFHILHLPLPWMLGAMTATLVASLLRVPMRAPTVFRPPMVTVIGVMLGASFTTQSLSGAGGWLIPMAGLMALLLASAVCCICYLRFIAGLDLRTAYFAGMPGGIIEMVMMGERAGAESGTIALIHAGRIVLVVFSIPFIVSIIAGDISTVAALPAAPSADVLEQLAWLVAICVTGALIGRLLRFPAHELVGPMLLSAGLHLSGVTSFTPPFEIVALAQVVIGATLGARFAGVRTLAILKLLLHASGLVAILLLLTTASSLALSLASGMRVEHLFLAYSPGGLAEMGLVALSLQADIALVVVFHIMRVILVAFCARYIFSLAEKMNRGTTLRAGPPSA